MIKRSEMHVILGRLGVGVLMCACTISFGSELAPITVCQLFNDLQSYGGKRLAVRGIYWNGLRQACSRRLVVVGREWPTALNLVDSEFAAADNEPVSFVTDRRSWDALDRLMIREARAGKREEIWVTMIGKLRTPVYVRADRAVSGGYGHLGAFPAELVVERVTDIAVKANATYDYRELLRRPQKDRKR